MRRMAFLLLLPALGAPALAQNDPAWIVELLDAPEWTVRRSATEALRENESITLTDMEALLEDETLSPEARLRIRTVAFERFSTSPRGAIGMSWLPSASNGLGLVVAELLDGFDAQHVLKPGDHIIEAEGWPVESGALFRAVILSRDPGDLLHIRVVRDGETLELAFRLGAYADLDNAGQTTPALLELAWSMRRTAPPRPTVESGFASRMKWNLAQRATDGGRAASTVRITVGPEGRVVRQGDAGTPGIAAAGSQAIARGGNTALRPGEAAGSDDAVMAEYYRRAHAEQMAVIAQLQARLRDPTLTGAQREAITRSIALRSEAVMHLRQWIDQLENRKP